MLGFLSIFCSGEENRSSVLYRQDIIMTARNTTLTKRRMFFVYIGQEWPSIIPRQSTKEKRGVLWKWKLAFCFCFVPFFAFVLIFYFFCRLESRIKIGIFQAHNIKVPRNATSPCTIPEFFFLGNFLHASRRVGKRGKDDLLGASWVGEWGKSGTIFFVDIYKSRRRKPGRRKHLVVTTV